MLLREAGVNCHASIYKTNEISEPMKSTTKVLKQFISSWIQSVKRLLLNKQSKNSYKLVIMGWVNKNSKASPRRSVKAVLETGDHKIVLISVWPYNFGAVSPRNCGGPCRIEPQ